MKKLACEMCGSPDLVKDGGVFVCQSCGCKYTIEEAKRMMIEGTVDVKGTVEVDNSAFVQKYLENARRAKEKEDWEETEKYYNLVEQNDPNNIEAIFYSAYGKAKASLVDGDIYKRQAAFNVLKNSISIIDDKYRIEDRERNKVVINSIAIDILRFWQSNFVYTEWKKQVGYGTMTKTNKVETYKLFYSLFVPFIESMSHIEAKDPEPIYCEIVINFFKGQKKLVNYEGLNKSKFDEVCEQGIQSQRAMLNKIKQKRIEAYWNEHSDEKASLDREKEQLTEKIDSLQAEIDSLPEVKEVTRLNDEIYALSKQKESLGIFKGKEKKAIQAKIDSITSDGLLSKAKSNRDTAVAPFEAQINTAKKRVSEIEAELNKDR